MLNVKIKYNDDDAAIYCTYSKERIECGEKYAIVVEQMYDGEVLELPYKIENLPEVPEEDEEEPWISPT